MKLEYGYWRCQPLGHWGTCPLHFPQFNFFQFTLQLHKSDSNFVRWPRQTYTYLYSATAAAVVQLRLHYLCSLYYFMSYDKKFHVVLWGGAVVQRLSVGLAINRSRVQVLLEVTLRNNLGQVVHTYVPLSVTKQCNLVPAKGW